MQNIIRRFLSFNEKVRYILIGGFNTVFGILCFMLLYLLLHVILHFLIIFYIAALVSILVSCITLKAFVFNSSNASLVMQICKAFSNQIILQILSSILLYILVKNMQFNPVLGQCISTIIIALIGYFVHKNISFS